MESRKLIGKNIAKIIKSIWLNNIMPVSKNTNIVIPKLKNKRKNTIPKRFTTCGIVRLFKVGNITVTVQVQGVTVSKWQYKNSSGAWADYPTTSDNTSITGGTLVVKPTHSVFVNNVAQIRVTTSENDVYDTLTISKIYDGAKGDKGNPGSAGTGGLSVVLGNEAQTIACTSEGKTSAASMISIPFTGYVGITQTACTCAVGTLPTGITVKTNTAATASAVGKLELAVAASSDLGSASTLNGNITLTFTISGKTVTKIFTWTKSKAGSNGANAIVFSVYAPNGTIVQNQSGSIQLATSAYSGTTAITAAAYQWAKYADGKWTNISGATTSTLSYTDIYFYK